MISPDSTEYFFGELPNLDKFDAIGIGPGLDTKSKTVKAFEGLFNQWTTPIVIDADGLNILAENRHLLPILPRNSILTPHHGEFERLAGSWNNDLERIKLQKEFSHEFNVHVLFKGPATTITTPNGEVFFNTTGNPGMATGGSGDVLTGIITGLLAQGYFPLEAAKAGCFIHGLAGDIAVAAKGEHALIASDIIDCISDAYLNLLIG
jgi:NAD(P)H-hydrate epimerase